MERYFLTLGPDAPEREVSQREFIAAERAAGFTSRFGPRHVATGGFGGAGIRGRVEYSPEHTTGIDPEQEDREAAAASILKSTEAPQNQPTFLELVELIQAAAYAQGEVAGNATALDINPGPMRTKTKTIIEYGKQVNRHRAEIERRLRLAREDHEIMWNAHLDDNASSRSRQGNLLRMRARQHREGGLITETAADHVHPDVLREYGQGQP